jgi:surface protein
MLPRLMSGASIMGGGKKSDPRFIITIDTTKAGSAADTFKLPLHGDGYDFICDWGDNTEPEHIVADYSGLFHNYPHVYSESGIYTIKISGSLPVIRFDAANNPTSDVLKIISLDNWGSQKWADAWGMFYGCSNMVANYSDKPDTSDCRYMTCMFRWCSSFNGKCEFNTENVVDMVGMFLGATSFNQPLTSFDTSKCEDMHAMFESATSFNQPLNHFDTHLNVSLRQMFRGCTYFNQDLNNWDTSKVTEFGGCFLDCTNFNGNISSWEATAATTMSEMFHNASSFNKPLPNFDTSNISGPLTSMFHGCTSFNQDLTFDLTGVTDTSYMFYGCSSFDGSLTFSNTGNIQSARNMFDGCASFTGKGNINTWVFGSVLDTMAMFRGCTVFNKSLNSWDTSKVQDMSYMFFACTAFNGNITSWDTGNCTNMNNMFELCTNFNQPIGTWDVSKVTSMIQTFYACSSLTNSLAGWDVSSCTNFWGMFLYASNFNMDLSSWDISEAINIGNMMQGTALSKSNYDLLLIAWSLLSVHSNLDFSVLCKYSSAAVSARTVLTGTHNWTITDGGLE